MVGFLPPAFTFHYELIITSKDAPKTYTVKKFTFHYELIITYCNILLDLSFRRIYISLWTNYNRKPNNQHQHKIKFTFHYELIITIIAEQKFSCWFIYISLWTNYNCIFRYFSYIISIIYISLWTNYNSTCLLYQLANLKFTFHYELIITVITSLLFQSSLTFTFHYELIITFLSPTQ